MSMGVITKLKVGKEHTLNDFNKLESYITKNLKYLQNNYKKIEHCGFIYDPFGRTFTFNNPCCYLF